MRRFEADNFNYKLAKGLKDSSLNVPDESAKEALSYVRQFVVKTPNYSKLYRGYINEKYLDELVRIREASSNRNFSSAVEALGCDGDVSTDVTDQYSSFEKLTFDVPTLADPILDPLLEDYRNISTTKTREDISAVRDVVESNRGSEVSLFLPFETIDNMSLDKINKV